MKKLLLMTLIMMASMGMRAQDGEGEIIYVDFEPDSLVQLLQINPHSDSRMDIDCDFDGLPDIMVYAYAVSPGTYHYIDSYVPEWEMHPYPNGDILTPVPMTEEAGWTSAFIWRPSLPDHSRCERFAVRHRVGDAYFYGWFRIYLTVLDPHEAWWCALDKMAYCDVPDFPLVWGQTSFLGVEENDEFDTFATVFPNPTNGIVTVLGDNLRQAEVVNMLGQKVLSVQGNDNELQIDMTALPLGVYFVNITDENGRKCVRKVVKKS